MRPTTFRVLAAGILLLGGLGFVPSVQALAFTENFSNDTLGTAPTGPFYTWAARNSGNAATNGVRLVDNQNALKTYQGASAGSAMVLNSDFCDEGPGADSPVVLTFDARITTLGTDDGIVIGVSNGASSPGGTAAAGKGFIGILMNQNSVVGIDAFMTVQNAQTNTALAPAANGWNQMGGSARTYTITISGVSCAETGEVDDVNHFTISVDDGTNVYGPVTVTRSGLWTGCLCYLEATVQTWGGHTSDAFIDNINIEDGDESAGGPRFCANIALTPENPSEPHEEWGYEYTDGIRSIEESTVGLDISMDDGFWFESGSDFDEWDWLAKHFPTGSSAMHTAFQIESAAEGTSSRFRAVYTLDGTNAPTDTSRGDGLTTQDFNNHVEVQITEVGSRWQVQVYYAEPTVNSGARTAFGPSVNFGNPNDPTSFMLWLDTRATAQPGEAKNFTQFGTTGFGFGSAGGTLQEGPYIAVTSPDTGNQVADRDQLIVAFRSFEFGPQPGNGAAVEAAFLNAEINKQWFIGSGTGAVIQAGTALNDNKDDGEADSNDSTCIWDDEGTTVVGAQGPGTSPGSSVSQPPPGTVDPGAGGLSGSPIFPGIDLVALSAAAGMSLGAFAGLVAVLLIILMTGALAFWGAGFGKASKVAVPIMGSVGFIGGVGLDLFFGLIPLWLAITFVIVAIGIFMFSRSRM